MIGGKMLKQVWGFQYRANHERNHIAVAPSLLPDKDSMEGMIILRLTLETAGD